MCSWNISKLFALASVVISTGALGSFDTPHYLGTSRDQNEFKFYLNGGEFLGRTGSFQRVSVTVHQSRKGQTLRALAGCVYHFEANNGRKDKIECAESTPGPLKGVAYARDLNQLDHGAPELALLVCVRRCGRQVPQRLSLEEANEDNG